MWQIYSALGSFAADYAGPATEKKLPPRVALVVIVGLALAAWVPVLLPLYLIFG